MVLRPSDEVELQKREAIGVIRASRFIRKYAHSKDVIDVATIQKIHEVIFKDAWPEIAGKWRTENLKITDSSHLPPHYLEVSKCINQANVEFIQQLAGLKTLEGLFMENTEPTDEKITQFDAVVDATAWIHHKITHIHPFREGNGRTARLVANLILERYGLVGISIKIERENKNRYLDALKQIDKQWDYEPLKTLIYEGLADRYSGLAKNIIS
jgi:fido (protein-threonine AMPylation protein)